jgi:hypothetical protein
MKNLRLMFLILISSSAFGQSEAADTTPVGMFDKYWPALTIFFMVFLVGYLITSFTKMVLDAWLKNKIIEKGLTESFVVDFLKNSKVDARQQALKWTLILSGVSLGLVLIDFVSALRGHAFTVLSISMTISFLLYFLLLKRSN